MFTCEIISAINEDVSCLDELKHGNDLSQD